MLVADVIVFKDTKRIMMEHVLIANLIWVKLYIHANIKMLRMVYGLMGNNVMMVIMIQEMVVIIFR